MAMPTDALRVGDLDGLGLANAFLDDADLGDTVCVDLEADFDMGSAHEEPVGCRSSRTC